MTSKELLEIIKNSTLRHDPDSQKRSLYERYYPLIEATFTYAPDKMELGRFSSLEGIGNQFDFENFIRRNDCETIRIKFEQILTDLKSFSQISIVGNEWLSRHQRSNFIASIFFIIALAVFAVAVFIFSILDNCNVLNTSGVASGVCGSLDFAFGIGFFIYEFVSDKKVKTMNNDMDQVQSGGIFISNKNVRIKGNGNNVGVVNAKILTTDDMQKQITAFIEKYSRN